MLVQPHVFLGFIQQGQYLAVHIAADVKQPVCRRSQTDQATKLVVGPVFDHFDRVACGLCNLSGTRLFEIEQIGAITASPDFSSAINQVCLAQSALNASLPFSQNFAVGCIYAGKLGLIDLPRKRLGIFCQITALLVLVRDRSRQRGAHNFPYAVGKPAFQPDIDRQPGKDRNGYGRDKSQKRKGTGKPQMQAGTR